MKRAAALTVKAYTVAREMGSADADEGADSVHSMPARITASEHYVAELPSTRANYVEYHCELAPPAEQHDDNVGTWKADVRLTILKAVRRCQIILCGV